MPQDQDALTTLMNVPATRARLLVVDDQPIHLQVLHRALSVDYQMFMATSGEQALRVCQEQHPDLVLLDVVMPDMDGFEVLQRIKTHPDTTDIPVIFVTAHGGDEIETQCLQAGAVDFIPKPVNPNVVKARVKTHLTLKFQSDFLRDMAFMDGLTGVSNRRHFDERLAVEWGRAQRSGSALSLVLLDVDFFKAYNDHYGHQAGDDCLQRVARTLELSTRRAGDLVARYGGEEFLLVLPHMNDAGGRWLGESIRQAVDMLNVPHAGAPSGRLTVSVGVATTHEAVHSDTASLLRAADDALYRAKRGGRNQVQVA